MAAILHCVDSKCRCRIIIFGELTKQNWNVHKHLPTYVWVYVWVGGNDNLKRAVVYNQDWKALSPAVNWDANGLMRIKIKLYLKERNKQGMTLNETKRQNYNNNNTKP